METHERLLSPVPFVLLERLVYFYFNSTWEYVVWMPGQVRVIYHFARRLARGSGTCEWSSSLCPSIMMWAWTSHSHTFFRSVQCFLTTPATSGRRCHQGATGCKLSACPRYIGPPVQARDNAGTRGTKPPAVSKIKRITFNPAITGIRRPPPPDPPI